MAMTRQDRLMATLKGQTVDRPAVNFLEIGGFLADTEDPDDFNIYNSPDWKKLLQFAWEYSDIIRLCSAVRQRSHEQEVREDMNSLNPVWSQYFTTRRYQKENRKYHEILLNIEGRQMRSLMRRDKNVDTVWQVEHLLDGKEDANAFLKLPDEVFYETINVNNLLEEENKVGNRGIVMVDTEDPICAVATLFSMENFTILAMTEPILMHTLLEKACQYIYRRTKIVAREFPGRLWRIYGPEFVTEPFLPPHLFKEYVVRYTGPMVKMIQRYGGYVRIHSHGRIKEVLDYIFDMGADAIDPIEPAPQGDVELSYVRKKYGKQMVLFGNIEVADIENMAPDKFEKIVERALEEGTCGDGRGFVLMPSASPYGRNISATTMRNYEIMVEKVMEWTCSNHTPDLPITITQINTSRRPKRISSKL